MPHRMANSHPRRQSTSAMHIDRIRKPMNTNVIMGACLGQTRTVRGSFRDESPAASRQSSREQQSSQLTDQFRRNRPRMHQMKTRDRIFSNARERVAPERRPMMNGEVVVAGRMRGRGAAAVI